MEAQINRSGSLLIKRKGTFQGQTCPLDRETGLCGHWCPLFLEADDCEEEYGFKQIVALSCGHGTPVHEIVKDERKEAPDAE